MCSLPLHSTAGDDQSTPLQVIIHRRNAAGTCCSVGAKRTREKLAGCCCNLAQLWVGHCAVQLMWACRNGYAIICCTCNVCCPLLLLTSCSAEYEKIKYCATKYALQKQDREASQQKAQGLISTSKCSSSTRQHVLPAMRGPYPIAKAVLRLHPLGSHHQPPDGLQTSAEQQGQHQIVSKPTHTP